MPPTTAINLITNALLEIGAYSQGESLPAAEATFGLSKLNRMLDAWNSDNLYIFSVDFLQLVLIPNIQPLLIGEGVQITAVSSDGTLSTFVGANRYVEGDIVSTGGIGTIGGLSFNVLNAIVQSATPLQFVLANPGAVVGLTLATPSNNWQAIYATPANQFPNYLTVTQRPEEIHDANIILNNLSPIVKCPLRLRDKDWWMANSIPSVPTSIPTDLFYDASFPNGKIFLWPLQNVTYGLELEVWNNLTALPSLTQQFYLPQGYEDAVTYGLGMSLAPSYGRSLSQELLMLATQAKSKIQLANSKSPKMATRDSGIPRGHRGGTLFNWLNGTTVPPR
jgi:hypothetical protein